MAKKKKKIEKSKKKNKSLKKQKKVEIKKPSLEVTNSDKKEIKKDTIKVLDSEQLLPLKVVGTIDSENLSPSKKPVSKWRKLSSKTYERLKSLLFPIKIILIIVLIFIVLIGIGVFTVFHIWGQDLPDVRSLKETNFAETTTIYDRSGNVLYKIFGEENRTYLPLKSINQKVIDATISIEDKKFYSHFGFDPIGIVRAQLNNLKEDSKIQGASTITQQLARNLYLSPEQTIDRKIKELLLSLQIEWYFTKDEILEMYLNKIPYGSNAFGIEAASKTFFNKPSSQLTLLESAVLASLPKGTSRYSPYGSHVQDLMGYCKVEQCNSPDDTNYVWGRKDFVLQRMLEDNKITLDQFLEAWEEGFDLKFEVLKQTIVAPHFVFYVKDYLEKKYGQEMVESGGLTVITTLDPTLQENAERIINEKYESNIKKYGANNAALVSLDPKTGGVLAMVGSVDYWNNDIDGQVNVTTSLRQPGSAFKPLVYANAINSSGMGSGTILADYKTKFADNYIPVNSDNTYQGRMTIRKALATSRNIPAVKAWFIGGGEEKLLEFLNKVGVKSLQEYKDKYNSNPERKWDFAYGPSMALGSGEVKLLDLVGAFATFANNGRYNPVNPILEIRDRNGNVIEKQEDKGEQVISSETAFIINSILSDVSARPAGSWRNNLTIAGQNIAVKTGTSNKKIGKTNYPNNLLTIGYTPTIISGTWVGNSNGKQTFLSAWGLYTAAPINTAFLAAALEGKEMVPFDQPEGIIKVGNDFYPPNWEKNKTYDTFKPLVLKDCSDEDRKKDPVACKSAEQQAKDDAAKKATEDAAAQARGPERPLNTGE